MMANLRVDDRGRTLLNGETQMPDGRYRFRYQDRNGRRQAVYSWRLLDTDTVPYGKRNNPSLREQERIINEEMEAMASVKDHIAGGVYETRDYEQFKTLLGNRDIEPERFRRIEKSMLIKQLPIPIVVNEKNEVIDGQGRLAVCKKHGFPIRYTVCEGLTIDDCFTANVYSTKWSSKDIINRYAKTGDEDYGRILDIMTRFGVSPDTAISAAGKSSTTAEQRETLKSGCFEFSEDNYAKAKERLQWALEIVDALSIGGKPPKQKQILIMSVVRCAKTTGYNHKRMFQGCRENAMAYKGASNLPDMLRQLAYFYNRRQRSHFMDTYGVHNSLTVVFDEKVNKFKSI